MAEATTSSAYRLTPGDWRNAFVRRGKFAAVVFSIMLAALLLIAVLWPSTYTSSGTILIEQQEVPAELVRSTISSYADQRIQIITQQVMTTENLFRIIQKYDLYTRERRSRAREVVMKKMRDDIDFKMISADVIDPRSGNPTKATIAFSVSYSNRSPDIAARVANELVSLYLQQNIESRKQRTADAESFLDDEARRLNDSIVKQHETLSKFKQLHGEELPELSQVNLQLLTRAEDERRETDARLRALDQQVVYLDAQLVQINPTAQIYASTGERIMSPEDRLKVLRTELARAQSLYTADHPDVLRLSREVAGLEKSTGLTRDANDLQRQIQAVRGELSAARERYAEDHPDVQRLQRSLAVLEQQAVAQSGATPGIRSGTEDPDNPAYIQIKAQREATGSERRSLLAKREEIDRVIAGYERRIGKAPEVEREYSGLIRELDNSELKYREVRQKQMEASVAQNLEEERKGERFSLIEPPLTPEKPESPNRVLLLTLGPILALGGAGGLVVLLELLGNRVRSRRDLEFLLRTPPLAVLPWIHSDSDRRLHLRQLRLAAFGAVTGVVLLLGTVHLLYRPLDVLWQVMLRRLGV